MLARGRAARVQRDMGWERRARAAIWRCWAIESATRWRAAARSCGVVRIVRDSGEGSGLVSVVVVESPIMLEAGVVREEVLEDMEKWRWWVEVEEAVEGRSDVAEVVEVADSGEAENGGMVVGGEIGERTGVLMVDGLSARLSRRKLKNAAVVVVSG